MQLYYESSEGTIIDLMSDGIYAQNPETLTDAAWNYTTISGVNGRAKIKRFYKDVQTAKLSLSIMAADSEEFNAIMSNMHKIFDRDVRKIKPGKMWWNGFYKECFVFSTSNSEYEELFDAVEHDIEIVSMNPYWTKTETYQYKVQDDEQAALDYPRDYLFDYDRTDIQEVVTNECIDAANFEITFYGPAEDPKITVGGQDYGLEITLSEGEYAMVNSITQKIKKVTNDGEEINVFDCRNRESNIFAKIPEGTTTITRPKLLAVDITLYDERGEPEWI